MSRYTTGSISRDVMAMAAILEAKKTHGILNLANVAFALPPDFDLSQDELDGILANMGGDLPAVEPEAPPEASEPQDAADASAPSMTLDEARERLVKLQNELSAGRGSVLTLQSKLRTSRDKLAKAIQTFISGQKPITREQLQRDHIRSEQARKARGEALNGRGQAMPGPSVVDRIAFYSRGGSANQGHGRGFARGAYHSSQRGMMNMDPRRGPVARVPSEGGAS